MNKTKKWLNENISLSERNIKNFYMEQFKKVVKEIEESRGKINKISCPICKFLQDNKNEYCEICGAKIKYSFVKDILE